MRFRRRNFRRAPREPLRWHRFAQSIYQTSSAGSQTSIASLFSPLVALAGDDQDVTVRRVIIDAYPTLNVPQGWLVLNGSAMFYLRWALVLWDTNNTTVPAGVSNLFGQGWDIIQAGCMEYGVFGPGSGIGPWQIPDSGTQNWINTKVNRVLKANETLRLVSQLDIAPQCNGGTPITPGEDNACFVHFYNCSVLWQRHMRRR